MLDLKHKKLDVWQNLLRFTQCVYPLIQALPQDEKYTLQSQMKRSLLSVTLNIAEGCSRTSVKDRRRFFEYALSSWVELDAQFELAAILGYLNLRENGELIDMFHHIFAQLSNLKKNTI